MIPEMIQAGGEGLISQFDFGPLPPQGGAFMVQPLLYETKSSLQGLQHIFLGLSDYSSMILKTFIQQSAISNSKQCMYFSSNIRFSHTPNNQCNNLSCLSFKKCFQSNINNPLQGSTPLFQLQRSIFLMLSKNTT